MTNGIPAARILDFPRTIRWAIVAVGTSLPELAAAIMSALKNEHDLAIGNVVGSNIWNLLAVLALGLGPAWFGWLLLAWAPLVILARVAMGVHYLSDVIAGAAATAVAICGRARRTHWPAQPTT